MDRDERRNHLTNIYDDLLDWRDTNWQQGYSQQHRRFPADQTVGQALMKADVSNRNVCEQRHRPYLTHSSNMAGRLFWSLLLASFLLLLQQDQVSSQSIILRSNMGDISVCSLTAAYLPTACGAVVPDASLFGTAPDGTFADFDVQDCNDRKDGYFLYTSGGSSQLYRIPTDFGEFARPVLVSNHPPFNTFDLCCGRVIYALTHLIRADNIDAFEDPLRIAATLYTDPEGRAIQHVEVCCHRNRYRILFSINDDGLYSMGMDGTDVLQMLDYGGDRTITDMDYNCDPNNGFVALASGMEVRLFDVDGTDTEILPIMYTDTLIWATNNLDSPDEAVQVSLATDATSGPVTATLWGPVSSEKVWITTAPDTSMAADGPLPSADFQAVFIGTSSDDTLPCPDEETCPCSESDDYHECCIGLCLPRNDVGGREYSCYCNNPDTKASDGCLSEGPYGSIPTNCRLDLIGAIKCQGGTREWSSSIYALSLYSKTGICPTVYEGKDMPMPRGATPFRTHGFHSSGYAFRAPTQFRNYGGDRYGLYTVTTGTEVNGLDGGLTDSLPVIFQESSHDLYADYVTKTPVLGENDYLRVNVRRPCDARRVRWRLNGLTLHKYKGKLTIPFRPFTSKQEGVYEAYFQGRIKREWRVIIWVSAATAGCSATCTSNGGICSYDGGCICPPGRSGVDCENNCPKGRFGVIGGCDYSCQEVFGDDCADCQDILLCLEAPAGCHCYPGYQLPNCTPCPRGYWGLNCANECAAGAACDPYFGNVGK